ncbi:MAG: nucleotidyltransferase domain-containing protein [Treponema sp.]|nr:nucleotidyltransferase domain-containing protein [Treponema sp.]
MKYGLEEADLSYIVAVLQQFPEIQKAYIFGSRAKGTYRTGSDIDIAIAGPSITFSTVSKLHALLEDQGPLPYFIDIIHYEEIKNPALKEHIDRVGKLIYEVPVRTS